ncbi:hypothetical protein LZ634_17635, partial [Kluyvera intermedia]|uniref:hypothetical protein n=1 Tax=Kluyvera intermedia TaxID=61648 RepID=UPI001F3F7042
LFAPSLASQNIFFLARIIATSLFIILSAMPGSLRACYVDLRTRDDACHSDMLPPEEPSSLAITPYSIINRLGIAFLVRLVLPHLKGFPGINIYGYAVFH